MPRRTHARDLRLVLGFVGQVRILHCFLLFGVPVRGGRGSGEMGEEARRESEERKLEEEARRGSEERKRVEKVGEGSEERKRGVEAEAGCGAKEENGW